MRNLYLLSFLFIAIFGCNKDTVTTPDDQGTAMYFPANPGAEWKKTPVTALGWNQGAIEPLKDFLAEKHTKSFMILVNGRIVMEEYFNGHSADADWEWNSAGKALVSAITGIARQENLLTINDKVSAHLGTAWTNMPPDKENLITLRHLLTMTSGIDDSKQWVIKSNLTYVADAAMGLWQCFSKIN